MNERQAIEIFHLLFSHRLSAKLDRNLFCLKGGCNLRFFFRSIRYSEDIDFDVHTVSVETLKKNVAKILDDVSFSAMLRHQGLEIASWSEPKQTSTTQRWKAQIKITGQAIAIPTKVEFSRRKDEHTDGVIEPIHPGLINEYRLQPILMQHYPLTRAIEQKIGALIGRAETQARDVIDLKILKDQLPKNFSLETSTADREKAVTTLMSVSHDDFKSQVWPYLQSDYQDFYKDKKAWSQLQDDVLRFLEFAGEET